MQADVFKLWGAGEPAARNAAGAIVHEVQQERVLRGEQYLVNWDMYQNRHEKYFKQRLDEDTTIFNYRKSNAIKSNLCGFTVDLSAKYLYGKSSKVIRHFSTNKATDDKMRELVEKFNLESFLLDAAKKASVFGETVVRLVPVDEDTGIQVVGSTTETTYPHPILMSPIQTFVKLNKWKRIAAVVSHYYATDYGSAEKFTITELVTPDSRWVWRSKGTLDLYTPAVTSATPYPSFFDGTTLVSSEQNTYALEDEFVHFPNNDDLRSDLVDIIDLNIALDEALTDKQHFFQKHGWPQLVSEVSLENVAYSPNKIWEIIPDIDDKKKVKDRIDFLTWDGKMEDHAKFIKNIERNIMILSNTAAISTGDLEAIGQLRSGAALITAHSVAIHKTEAKQIVWERNEKALIKALSKMDSLFHNEKVEGRYPELDLDIRFPKTFVPGAEMEQTQIHNIEATGHLRPLADIIEEIYGDITPDEVEEKRQQILQDARDIVDSNREILSGTLTPDEVTSGGPGQSGTPMQKSAQQKKPAS